MYSMYGAIQKCIDLVGIAKTNKPSGRPRRRWEDNNNIDLRENGCDSGDWMDLTEDRDQRRGCVRAVMNLRVS